jgi:hypothetical protein
MKLVQGVGINDMPRGSTTYIGENGKQAQHGFYRKWINMISRCYDTKYHHKQPTYIGCSVCEEWKTLSKFKEWFDQQPLERQSWCLDKDLLITGNKVYSPETCILVPHWLNNFITENCAARGQYMLGVCWNKRAGKFQARLRVDGNVKTVGYFTDELSAHIAWKTAKLQTVHDMKDELNQIDHRLYEVLVKRYS